jgi:hypothetical protein
LAEADAFSPDSEESRFEAMLRKHSEGFFQNVIGGLFSWATANTYYNHKRSSRSHLWTICIKALLAVVRFFSIAPLI